MKGYILNNGQWVQYDSTVLVKNVAYKFVAWVRRGDGTLLVLPEDLSCHGSFRHNCIVENAYKTGVVKTMEVPNAYGALCVVFEGQSDKKRIVSWTSQRYGKTDDDVKDVVRSALELEDVVY